MQLSVWQDLKINPNFFSLIKNKWNESIGVSPPRKSTLLKLTKTNRAHILNNNFSSFFPVDDKTSPNVQSPKDGKMHDINITKEGITK